jgi:hypothetical protein
MPEKDDTVVSRPMPKRPENGLLAWQATIGYMNAQYSLDAMLTMQAYPTSEGAVVWSAKASWGRNAEQVQDTDSLPTALRDLWHEVASHHILFDSKEAAFKSPAHYHDDQWLDADTALVLERLVLVTARVFGQDWLVVLVYQVVDNPTMRFQARLLAQGKTVQTSGHGPSLRDACRDLYRNAAPYYVSSLGKNVEDIE